MSLLTIKRSITSLFLSPADAGVFLFKSCFLTGTMSSCQWQHLQWWCKSWTGYLLHLVTTSWFLLFPEVVQTGQHRSLQKSVLDGMFREKLFWKLQLLTKALQSKLVRNSHMTWKQMICQVSFLKYLLFFRCTTYILEKRIKSDNSIVNWLKPQNFT